MKISHIVTNGCSFTYGDGLPKPGLQSWPQQLANKLGVDVVNLGKSGAGNDMIFRRTYEYFYEDLLNKNNPFYVIMFSNANRKERYNKFRNQYETISPPNNETDPGVIDYVENFDLTHYIKQTMHYKSAIRNMFLTYNIPYLFLTSIPSLYNEELEAMKSILRKQVPNHLRILDQDINDIGDASMITAGTPRTKCMHWGVEGHTKIADYVYENIFKNYKNIEIEPSTDYLTLEDYRKNMNEFAHVPDYLRSAI